MHEARWNHPILPVPVSFRASLQEVEDAEGTLHTNTEMCSGLTCARVPTLILLGNGPAELVAVTDHRGIREGKMCEQGSAGCQGLLS